jgi:phosphoserine aminotransferase
MTQVFNFSAGPAVLPKEVLQQAAAEMLDWHGSGMSVMEMSHRGPEFISIYTQAEADLRELLDVPANYRSCSCRAGGWARIRHRAAEPAGPQGAAGDHRLRAHRFLVQQVDQGSGALRAR